MAARLPPQQRRSRASVERALQGALEVIAESGWDGFTMPAVSAKADVSVRLLHKRFRNKERLFEAAHVRALAELEAFLDEAYSDTAWTAATVQEAVAAEIRTLGRVFQTYGRLLRGFREAGLADPRVAERAGPLMEDGQRRFTQALLRHRDAFTHPDPELAVDVCFRAVFAVFDREVLFSDAFTAPRHWEHIVADLASASSAYLVGPHQPRRAPMPSTLPVVLARPADTETASRLVDQGLLVLAECDYAGITASAVSERAELAVGGIYNHFAGLDDLIRAIEQAALERLVGDAQALFAPATARSEDDHDPVARVLWCIQVLALVVEGNRAAARVLARRRPEASDIQEHATRAVEQVCDLFCAALGPPDIYGASDTPRARAFCFRIVYALQTDFMFRARDPAAATSLRTQTEEAVLCVQYLAAGPHPCHSIEEG